MLTNIHLHLSMQIQYEFNQILYLQTIDNIDTILIKIKSREFRNVISTARLSL